ncbi:MAG: hypothetical protein VZR54_06845 [Ruminococcus sp.]|nr:hypothetical protein [Ruminococcus sp.]
MKISIKAIVITIIVVAGFICSGIFLSNSGDRIEGLFRDTIKSLDNGESIDKYFNSKAKEKSRTLDVDSMALGEFYQGNSSEIKKIDIYHERDNQFRVNAVVKTSEAEYFVTIAATGSRVIDELGIRQFIIEDNKTFKKKDLFKKQHFTKYEKKAEEYGITIRMKGDKR